MSSLYAMVCGDGHEGHLLTQKWVLDAAGPRFLYGMLLYCIMNK
jgi:hypothetical protein